MADALEQARAELVAEALETEKVRRRNTALELQLAGQLADYDRRRAHWWGRTLLWLLRTTT